MEQIYTGAHTAYVREPIAVFLIGISINRWRAVHKWWPVVRATRPMLRELAFGLGRATYVIPVHRGNETARRRFDAAAQAPGAEGRKNDRAAPPA